MATHLAEEDDHVRTRYPFDLVGVESESTFQDEGHLETITGHEEHLPWPPAVSNV